MDPKLVTTLPLIALVAWGLYRRARRTFGRQVLSVIRLRFRIGVLAVVTALLLVALGHNLESLGALLGGVVLGGLLGYVGLRHTTFESTPQGRFYTPHTYMGLLVTALFIGRLIFRFLVIYPQARAVAQINQDPFAALPRSPLTLVIFGVLIGYYVFFNFGVLRKSQQLDASATQTPKP